MLQTVSDSRYGFARSETQRGVPRKTDTFSFKRLKYWHRITVPFRQMRLTTDSMSTFIVKHICRRSLTESKKNATTSVYIRSIATNSISDRQLYKSYSNSIYQRRRI